MSPVNYPRLKTNLQLAIQRIKLLIKKKTEAVQRSRKEIAEYLENEKIERAKIRVEHIIREDYLIEAMEIVELLCDLLLARFGMIQQMKTLDDGLEEAVASLIWVAPRMSTDVKELKIVADMLTQKYGKNFADSCKENSLKNVNEKLMLKLGVQAPPKILVENYLIAIAKTLGVKYEPDQAVLAEDQKFNEGGSAAGIGDAPPPPDGTFSDLLIDFANQNKFGGGGGGGSGLPEGQPPPLPDMPPATSGSFYPSNELGPYPGKQPPKIGFIDEVIPDARSVPPSYESVVDRSSNDGGAAPPPTSSVKSMPADIGGNTRPDPPPPASNTINLDNLPSVPNLPDIPTMDDDLDKQDSGDGKPDGKSQDDVDFEELRRRFDDLKKRK